MTQRRDPRTGVPDPVTTFHFFVDIGEESQAIFTECSALEIETEVLTYEEGGLNDHVHRLPGRSKVGDVTLKQGIALPNGQQNAFWNWYLKTLSGHVERRHVTITVYDQHGQEVQRWNLREAYPIKWVGPAYNSGQSAMAIQSLTLTHRGIIVP